MPSTAYAREPETYGEWHGQDPSSSGASCILPSLPELDEDILEEIVKHTSPSLNICLVSKLFKADRSPMTRTSSDATPAWLWDEARKCEALRRSSDERRPSQVPERQKLVMQGAAFRGDLPFLESAYRELDGLNLNLRSMHMIALAAAEGGHLEVLQ